MYTPFKSTQIVFGKKLPTVWFVNTSVVLSPSGTDVNIFSCFDLLLVITVNGVNTA